MGRRQERRTLLFLVVKFIKLEGGVGNKRETSGHGGGGKVKREEATREEEKKRRRERYGEE